MYELTSYQAFTVNISKRCFCSIFVLSPHYVPSTVMQKGGMWQNSFAFSFKQKCLLNRDETTEKKSLIRVHLLEMLFSWQSSIGTQSMAYISPSHVGGLHYAWRNRHRRRQKYWSIRVNLPQPINAIEQQSILAGQSTLQPSLSISSPGAVPAGPLGMKG